MARPIEPRPRGVLRAPDGLGAYGRYAPAPPLEPWVEHLWWVAWKLEAPLLRETLPHPSVHLLLEAGRSGVAGVATGRFTRTLEGRGRVLGVKFRPGCFRPFLGRPLSEITDRVLPLAEVFGPAGPELEAAVLACGDTDAAAALAEAFLLARLPAPDPQAALARDIVARILADPELTRAEAVAEAAGMGLRSLQRLFSEYVGVGPKWVIRRYRLHEALAKLDAGEAVDLAALALDLGWYDQAHFIRDFKALVGRTPAAYTKC